jgi:hypothetical protein
MLEQRAALDAQIRSAQGEWPAVGDTYWMMEDGEPVNYTWKNKRDELAWQALGMVHMNETRCQRDYERKLAHETLVQAVHKGNVERAWVIDYNLERQPKYYPTYDIKTRALSIGYQYDIFHMPVDLLGAQETWDHLVREMKHTVLLWMGVDQKGV